MHWKKVREEQKIPPEENVIEDFPFLQERTNRNEEYLYFAKKVDLVGEYISHLCPTLLYTYFGRLLQIEPVDL